MKYNDIKWELIGQLWYTMSEFGKLQYPMNSYLTLPQWLRGFVFLLMFHN
jgi:hypothetical protein